MKVLKAVVCDIGHVIARGSILNVILSGIGRDDCVRKLYDAEQYYRRDCFEYEAWVEDVINEKILALTGLSLDQLNSMLSGVSMTPRFDHFINKTHNLGLPVLLVGAVPELIAHLLLKRWNLDFPHISISGTTLRLSEGKISGLQAVCTPVIKRETVSSWLDYQRLEAHEAIYIGDSLGDLLSMSLFPKQNRIAMNASIQLVKAFCDFCMEDDFSEVINIIDNHAILDRVE